MKRKPRIFIGSSVESLHIADAVNKNLDHEAEVTIWREGTFKIGSSTLEALETKAKSVDFSLFIFSPDDITLIRKKEEAVARDNVVFELGLFIGTLGKERCFILKPRDIDLHFPSDLAGIIIEDYESNRSDNDLVSAVTSACVSIKDQMKKLEPRMNVEKAPKPPKNAVEVISTLNEIDFEVMKILIDTFTAWPGGFSHSVIKSGRRKNWTYKYDLALIRLAKLGYIDKSNSIDDFRNDIYVYNITEEGVQILLQRENQRNDISSEFEEDIPF